jgi:hypothetical protein
MSRIEAFPTRAPTRDSAYFQRRKIERIQLLVTQQTTPANDSKKPASRALDTCNSHTVPDAVAARRIVRQAPEDILRASYQNQTPIQEHPMAKAKKTVKKVAAKKPAAKKAVKKVAAKKKK